MAPECGRCSFSFQKSFLKSQLCQRKSRRWRRPLARQLRHAPARAASILAVNSLRIAVATSRCDRASFSLIVPITLRATCHPRGSMLQKVWLYGPWPTVRGCLASQIGFRAFGDWRMERSWLLSLWMRRRPPHSSVSVLVCFDIAVDAAGCKRAQAFCC